MGNLGFQNLFSGDFQSRTIFFQESEPPISFLSSDPENSIYIGRTSLCSCPFFWNPALLANPHIAILGVSGSGKSYLVKSFLVRASLVWGANALILDWSGEYASWVKNAGGKVIDFQEGQSLNLLDAPGSRETRAMQILSSLEILTDISSFPSQKMLTEQAIRRSYKNAGKKMPTIADVIAVLGSMAGSSKTGNRKEECDACAYRLSKLCLAGQNYFFGSSTINTSSLSSSGLVCVDLHSLPGEQSRSLAGLTILQFIIESMRARKAKEGPPSLFVVVDEAWKIAQDEKSEVVSLIREGRKYGFSLIVASQNPTDLSKAILSNAGTIFIFRMLLREYKDYLRTSLSYSDQIAGEISSFPVGSAAVHLIPKGKSFASPVFIIKKIDGEELLANLSIWGVDMKFEFEKDELRRKMLSFGLEDAQVSEIFSKFAISGNSLPAQELVILLEKYGFARLRMLSLFRELGASESALVSLFSSLQRARLGADSDKISTIFLEEG